MAEHRTAETERFIRILTILEGLYPTVPSMLQHNNAFELLIGVILSAQTTDAQVNEVLPVLFAAYPSAQALAAAEPAAVEAIIHSLGFFRRKAVHIIAAAHAVAAGGIPQHMDDLVAVPGVGRKSAGVILHHVYNKPAIIVDTHFGRVARRLGFSTHTDPHKLEQDIAALLGTEHWGSASMRLNYHGRQYCHARKPRCSSCPAASLCPQVDI